MTVRSGAQYIERLHKTPREVWLRGERVDDVTAHPALRRPAAQIARLYDMQHDERWSAVLTRASPAGPVGTAFVAPRSYEDLLARREAYHAWATASLGQFGRSPDFLNTTLMAFADEPAIFARLGNRYAENLQRYYEYVRDHDLFLTHALVAPQIDRERSAADQHQQFLHLGVVKETADGLLVRGARMLATLAPVADEILTYNLPGLRLGDERYAVAFAVAIDTPGLRLISREPYDDGTRNTFDHPLSTHFEEPDCLVVFDDVLVPWDRVFLHGNVELANELPARTHLNQHTGHQSGVRGLVKMQLITGVCIAISRAVKIDNFLHVKQGIGEALAATEICRALLVAAETEHETSPSGTVRPRMEALQTLRVHLSAAYPKVVELLRTLGAGGLLMMPSAHDLVGEIGQDVARYLQGADGMPAEHRMRLYKLAWELCGDAFGQRAALYERYFAGDPVRLLAGNYETYDTSACLALVEAALALAGDARTATTAGSDGRRT